MWKEPNYEKNKNEITISSSAAEYLTYIAATGDNSESKKQVLKKMVILTIDD